MPYRDLRDDRVRGSDRWLQSPTSTDGGPIRGVPPIQIRIVGAPQVVRDPQPDTLRLVISVVAPDSSMHRNWRATSIRVSTDVGFDREVLAVPFACLVPTGGGTFPDNFDWFSCNQIGVATNVVLSESQIDSIEVVTSGRLTSTHLFKTLPGGQYLFEVPTGFAATAEAARRVGSRRDHGDVLGRGRSVQA